MTMNLTALTEAEFLGTLTQTGETTGTAAELIEGYGINPAAEFPVLRDFSDFRIVSLRRGDTGLQDSAGTLVGAYIGDIVMIDHHTLPAGVRGASVPLILYAVAQRSTPPHSRIVSPSGEKALRRAWRVANGIEGCPWWP